MIFCDNVKDKDAEIYRDYTAESGSDLQQIQVLLCLPGEGMFSAHAGAGRKF